jgi:hypothetical protein
MEPVVKILPAVDKILKYAPQGLKLLISSLVDSDFDVDEAIRLCTLTASQEFNTLGERSWEDIPPRLRSWLRDQKGLRIDKNPISSTVDLLRVHRLLCRRTAGFRDYEVGLTTVILDVALGISSKSGRTDQ